MLRANILLLTLFAAGCGSSGSPQPASARVTPPPAPSTPANDVPGRLVNISRFDCVSAEQTDSGNDFPWQKGLSRWAGGGPGGAAWNANALRCAIDIHTRCEHGEVDAEMRIGGKLVGAAHAVLHAGAQLLTLNVGAPAWENHYDEDSQLTKRFPYRTATFSATIIASCQQPDVLGPSEGPRLEFADDLHFTAGFAGGE
jgi:hypothetical protein